MANILCIYENIIATVAGFKSFFSELSNYDERINTRFKSIIDLNKRDLEYCDVLFMIRPNNRAFSKIAKIIKKYNTCVVFYIDDDLFHLPKGCIDIPWRKKSIVFSARQSDIIVSSSRYICNGYSNDFNIQRNFILDTAVPNDIVKMHIDGKNDRIKIVYAAGLSHKNMFDKYVKPILKELNNICGNMISITFMGVHPELNVKEYNFPIYFIDSLPLKEYRDRIEKENFDIGLAPLISNEFTKCKYYNKFIEYAMFGIVGLYSNTEPYTFIIKNKENGILVNDDPNDWLKAICEAVKEKELIAECRAKSYDLLRDRFDSNKIMDKFINDIPEMVDRHKEKEINGIQLQIIQILYNLSRIADWVYKTGYYFKRGGIKAVIEGLKRRIKTVKIEKE